MLKALSQDQVERFHERGYLSPIQVFTEAEMAAYREHLAEFEAHEGGKLSGAVRNKSHLFLRWLYDMATHSNVLDAVEDILGGNILLYHAQWFIKEPQTRDFVSLHQDSAYWSLTEAQGLSAWIAFDVSDQESGCMQVVPYSHEEALPHADVKSPHNMLWRGQTVMAEIDKSAAVEMPLRPGEMSFHHARIIHGSGPNQSNHRRIGYSLRFIPTSVGRTGPRDSAMLVRGVDNYENFDLEPAPRADYEPASVQLHADINRRFMEHYTAAKPERAAQNAS